MLHALGCTVWAGVRLPPDIIMGGRQFDSAGQLVAANRFLMAFFVMGVERLGFELQSRNCSTACRAGMKQNLGVCINAAVQAPTRTFSVCLSVCLRLLYFRANFHLLLPVPTHTHSRTAGRCGGRLRRGVCRHNEGVQRRVFGQSHAVLEGARRSDCVGVGRRVHRSHDSVRRGGGR